MSPSLEVNAPGCFVDFHLNMNDAPNSHIFCCINCILAKNVKFSLFFWGTVHCRENGRRDATSRGWRSQQPWNNMPMLTIRRLWRPAAGRGCQPHHRQQPWRKGFFLIFPYAKKGIEPVLRAGYPIKSQSILDICSVHHHRREMLFFKKDFFQCLWRTFQFYWH
jgi:hypothetical protein